MWRRLEVRRQAGASSQPSRTARAASYGGGSTPNRSKMRERWVSTVFEPMPSAAPILVVAPPIRDESHDVVFAGGQARASAPARANGEGQFARGDRRSQPSRSDRGAVLSTKPAAPRLMAASAYCG